MPSRTTKIKTSSVKEYRVTIGQGNTTWKPGVISLVQQSRLPIGAVVQAKNCMQTEDGVWSNRWGSSNYGASFTGPVTAFSDFLVYNADGTTTQSYMIIDNGALKYAKDAGAWTTVTGHTFSTTVWTNMLQYGNKLLICNGVDAFSYVDLTNMTWTGFTGLSTPGTVTPTLGSSLSATNPVTTLYYQVTAISTVGETPGSAVATQAVNTARNNWYNPNATSAVNNYYVALSWTKISNASGYNIYLSDGVSGVSYYIDSVPQPSGATVYYTDYGSTAINDFIQVPLTDSTVAPKFNWIALSDNRLWATGDPLNPNRLYWAATGVNNLAFNAFFGGGWVDIMPGGRQQPKFVGQFRDGKGTPMTTILLSEPTGYGSTWHCTITTATIGNTIIAIPTVIQSMGTFGTGAPRSVVETNQNVYFHSGGPAGIYSTGSIATLFNVLATNEISIMIRPDIQSLTLSATPNICSIEFQRKLLYSVPYGSSTNNRIMVWDLEKQNWNPYAFDFGVKHFVRYTDNSGGLHLLCIPITGTKILEINSTFVGDNNIGFPTLLQTGLIHPTPDHVQFAQIRYVYYEFGSPSGSITLTFSGTPKNLPLSQLASYSVGSNSSASNIGFDSFAFSAKPFSFVTVNPVAATVSSAKDRIRISKLLNNWQAQVSSTSVSALWTLNQITVLGVLVPTADPSLWIVN